MTIPRFNARVSQIKVPSMKNYQEEQNASIAKSLGDFGMALLGGAEQLELQRQKAISEDIGALEEERVLAVKNNWPQGKIDNITNKLNELKSSQWLKLRF